MVSGNGRKADAPKRAAADGATATLHAAEPSPPRSAANAEPAVPDAAVTRTVRRFRRGRWTLTALPV